MFYQIFTIDNLILCVIAVELLLLFIAQLRTNVLIKRMAKIRSEKRAAVKQLKEEVKMGESKIPVVKFEKEKPVQEKETPAETQKGIDPQEIAVLQQMMTEFFG